jgi:hypothetical protein
VGVYATLGADVVCTGHEDALQGKGMEGRKEFENEEARFLSEQFDDLVCRLSLRKGKKWWIVVFAS